MKIINLNKMSFLLIIITIISLAKPLIAQEQQFDSAFYLVGEKKIRLKTSNDYKAFNLKPNISAESRNNLETSLIEADVGSSEKTPILEKYGIVLIRINKTNKPSSFNSQMMSMLSRSEVESEAPVFSIDGSNVVLTKEYIVQFKSNVTKTRINQILNNNDAKIVHKNIKIKRRYIISFDGKTIQESLFLSNEIHKMDEVIFSEPNFIQLLPARPKIKSSIPISSTPSPSTTTPNDRLYSKQWGLNNTGSTGVAGADIHASEAWDLQQGLNEIIVAIIDDGVDIGHPDLSDKIVTPYDATDGDNNQSPNTWDGHGTACAGIAAAMTNNSTGIAGVAWNVRILPVRIATSACGTCSWMTSNSIIEDGLRTAVDRGAHVLSNSWGGGSPSNAINSAIDYAISKKRVVVFAAGNDSSSVSYPANLSKDKDIITVSATNEWDQFKTKTSNDQESWWGSNFGSEVNISAPGVHIYTTDIRSNGGYDEGDYTSTFNGTSSATPFVAGAAALLLSQKPSLNPSQVRKLLQDSSDDLGSSGFDDKFGHGRLNILNALKLVRDEISTVSANGVHGFHFENRDRHQFNLVSAYPITERGVLTYEWDNVRDPGNSKFIRRLVVANHSDFKINFKLKVSPLSLTDIQHSVELDTISSVAANGKHGFHFEMNDKHQFYLESVYPTTVNGRVTYKWDNVRDPGNSRFIRRLTVINKSDFPVNFKIKVVNIDFESPNFPPKLFDLLKTELLDETSSVAANGKHGFHFEMKDKHQFYLESVYPTTVNGRLTYEWSNVRDPGNSRFIRRLNVINQSSFPITFKLKVIGVVPRDRPVLKQ